MTEQNTNDDITAPGSDKPDTAKSDAKKDTQPMIPKARLDEEIAKRKAAEESASSLATLVLAEIPEKYRDLIPAGLTAADQVAWFQKAKATGVFEQRPVVPETDTSKPTTTPKDIDVSTLPPNARIASGYAK